MLSRVDQYELDASNEEVLELMRQLAAQGFEGLSADECLEVVDFIGEFSATRELSLAAVGTERSARCSTPGLPESIGGSLLPANSTRSGELPRPKVSDSRTYDMDCLRQVVEDYPEDVAEQEAAFRALTRRSRATFFRLKKALAKTVDQIDMTQAAMGVG